MPDASSLPADSPERWRQVRAVLTANRQGLSHAAARLNAEGRVITGGRAEGIPFTADTVTRLSGGGEPVQASGAALLQLAWQHRRHLLG